MDFAAAASRLLAAHAGWRDRDLVATPRGLRAEAIGLALRPYRVTLVRTLRTRLQLTSSGEDVTAAAPSDDGPGPGSGASGAAGAARAAGAASTSAAASAHNDATAHDDAWYVDRRGSELLLLATAPAGLSREVLLAQAVCEVLGIDAPTSLAPLLAVNASQALPTLARLRVVPPPQWAAASAIGSAGTPCTPEDEALLQLRPMRAYFAGEVVCISASQLGAHYGAAGVDEADGYVYAEVDAAVPAATAPHADGRGGGGSFDGGGGALFGMHSGAQVTLRVGSQRTRMQCLSLQVHSFRSLRRERAEASGATAAGGRAQDGADGAMPGATPGSSTGAPTGPSSAELVEAVSAVLRRAGVPLGLETTELLEANLALKTALNASRSELEEQALETTRCREQLEAMERVVTCQVCMTRRTDTLLGGCGHLLCATCARQVGERCPYCRAVVTGQMMRMRW